MKYTNYILFGLILFLFIFIFNKRNIFEVNTHNNKKDLILVNKNYPLNKDYVPKDLIYIEDIDCVREVYLDKETYYNLKNFNDFLIKNNIFITIFSGYRSYMYQELIYTDSIYQAKPGYSEHQTGLAVDISLRNIGLIVDFKYTIEYKIILNNCYKFGFILRYPENKESVTGYPYEPWHFRYVGVNNSFYIHQNNLTLEEFLIKNNV